MSMALTVLGGAAAWPNPGQGCSSYLLRRAGASVVLDCGPDTLLELRRQCDYRTVDAVVISHCHADHILDLVPYRYGLVYGPRRPPRPIPLWLPPGGLATLRGLAAALGGGVEDAETFWTAAFDVREYDPEHKLEIGTLRFAFRRTQHPLPCFAMRIEDDAAALFYSADTGDAEPLASFAQGVGLAVVEATMPGAEHKPRAQRVHLTPRRAGELARQAGAGTLLLTHLWCERPDAETRAEAAEAFAGRIEIARPGLTLDV